MRAGRSPSRTRSTRSSPTGGTVCLAVGIYHLDETGLTIADAASVTVRGQGPKTLLLARGPGIAVERSSAITLQDFSIIGARTSVITADTTVLFTAQRLVVAVVAAGDAPVAGITLSGAALETTLRENIVVAPFGIHGGAQESLLVTADLDVRANVLLCGSAGVFFEGRVAHTLRNLIVGNTVGLTAVAGLHALGVIAPSGALTVADNWVTTSGAGIEVGPSGYVVRGNDVRGSVESTGAGRRGQRRGLFAAVRGATRIVDNQVRDSRRHRHRGERGRDRPGSHRQRRRGHAAGDRDGPQGGVERRDRVRQHRPQRRRARSRGQHGRRHPDRAGGACGRRVEHGLGVGAARTARDSAVGIAVLGCADSRVAGNASTDVGFDEAPGRAIGIAVVGLARTDVHGNSSRRTDVDVDADPTSDWTGLLIGPAFEGQVTHETIGSFSAVRPAPISISSAAAPHSPPRQTSAPRP